MEDSIAYQMLVIRNDIVAYCNEQLQTIGITQGQLFFLLYVAKHDSCTPGELAKALHMDNGHATRTIAKLVEQGFMKQYPHKVDKRSRVLRLTSKGKEAYLFARSLFQAYDQMMIDDISNQEREVLHQLVHRIREKRREHHETSNCI